MKKIFIQYRYFFVTLIVLFNLCYSLFFIYFGIDLQDGFYHINRMITNDPYVMAFLSYKIGYFWFLLFGKSVIGFRVLNVIIYQLILYAPFLLIESKENKYKFIFFSLILNFCISLLNWNLLGYDTFSFLFITYALVYFIKFIFQATTTNLLFFSLFSVLAVASRMPNVLIIPIVCFLILISGSHYKLKLKQLLTFVLVFSVLFTILILLNYTSFPNYLVAINESLKVTNEDHGLVHLLNNYMNHFFKICKYLIVLVVLYWMYMKSENNKKLRYVVLILSVFPFVLFLKFVFLSGFNTKIALFFGAIIIAFLSLEFKSENPLFTITSKKIIVLSLILFQFLPCAGSNSGLKYSGIVIVFFSFIYFQSQLKYKKYFFFLILILVPFLIFEKFKIKFMDENFTKLNTKLEIENLAPIRTTSHRNNFINEVLLINNSEVKKGNNVLIYGSNAHIFNYLVNNSKSLFKSFPMKLNNKEEFNFLKENYFKNKQPVVILVPVEVDKYKLSYFENELIKLGYNRSFTNDYILLKPKEI